MIGIWTDCRGCIIAIFLIPGSSVWRGLLGFISVKTSGLSLLGLVCWAGGVAISSPCPVWIFICTFLWTSMSLSTSTSCHSGNTLLCKETIQCLSTTSGRILIPHYNTTTLSLRHTLGDKIDNAREKQKKQIWPNGMAESSTVLFQNFDDQLCNWVQLNSQEMVPSINASY